MMLNACKVMADQQHRHPALAAQTHKQCHDFTAQGSVERAYRFVGNKIARAMRQRRCNQNTLPFPARKQVRILR